LIFGLNNVSKLQMLEKRETGGIAAIGLEPMTHGL